ncbi:MAG TPA: hypothetical protein VGC21_13465 [Telluria sp.]
MTTLLRLQFSASAHLEIRRAFIARRQYPISVSAEMTHAHSVLRAYQNVFTGGSNGKYARSQLA